MPKPEELSGLDDVHALFSWNGLRFSLMGHGYAVDDFSDDLGFAENRVMHLSFLLTRSLFENSLSLFLFFIKPV